MYEYAAKVVKVVDGDTVDLEVDLGFSITLKERFRLHRINAPEKRGPSKPQGEESTLHLMKLTDGVEITIKTIKDQKEKYGRFLVEIYRKSDGACLNDLMVHDGHASYHTY